ncbi:MAG: ankyrin repeat domain-containing protein [Acidobacteriia bacterium]|nr:ankyrin repeat domain-containing protein [Terriglobia bacterium]
MGRLVFLFAIWVPLVFPADSSDTAGLFPAIRRGDAAFLKSHLTKSAIDARDRRGATLLMHAAAFGNLETLKLLLDAGADVNARNDFDATALLWGARDPDKARLLIARGANVNARSRQGRTPLMLAALRPGGSPVVALMLTSGADVHVADKRGNTALGLAASIGEVETMRLLLSKGADPEATNEKGETPLIMATKSKQADAVGLLIQKGVRVNVTSTSSNTVRHGPIAMIKLTPLHRAAAFGPLEMVGGLLKAGADVNARDSRSLTPLIFAVATEYAAPQIVQTLLKAGADVNVRDNAGETALDWAEKFGYPQVIAALKNAGAERGVAYAAPKRPDIPRAPGAVALSRSLGLLQRSSTEFFNQSGCVSCHHQPLIARAQRAARAAGAAVDETAAQEQLSQMKAQWSASQEEFLQSLNPAGGPNRLAENLLGLEAAGYQPDTITDAAVVDLAESQDPEGYWAGGEEEPRPPITESVIAGTARALRAIQAYSFPARGQEFASRIARARAWLKQSKPASTEDFAMRLLGLAWAGAAKAELREAALPLLALQRQDGGWAGNPYLSSDAFSTGEALTALGESGALRLKDGPYRRGVDYLLATQYADGSWYVRSRAIKFQPYFESGFPFGPDQWISAAATAWAAQAIAPSIQPRASATRVDPAIALREE